jgi:hypothetical protein
LLLLGAPAAIAAPQDIRGLAEVTLGTATWYGFEPERPNAERFASESAQYGGTGTFTGIEASPSANLNGVCAVWACDRSSAEAAPGRVCASVNQVQDAGGVYGLARIVYRCPGPGTVRLVVEQAQASFYPIKIALADGSWDCTGCYEKTSIIDIPSGGDLIIEARTFYDPDGGSSMSFSLERPDGGLAPYVVSAFVVAQALCLVTEPEFDIVGNETTFDPRSVRCADFITLQDPNSYATYNQFGWLRCESSELILEAKGHPSADCPVGTAQGVASATLHATAPIRLERLQGAGGSLTLNGAGVSAASFPVTLPAGAHSLEFRSNSNSFAYAQVSILATDDPDACDDCNFDNLLDGCSIFEGLVADIDGNWLPDDCQRARGDLLVDGMIDSGDLAVLLAAWNSEDPDADLNDDGIVAASDIMELLNRWGPFR